MLTLLLISINNKNIRELKKYKMHLVEATIILRISEQQYTKIFIVEVVLKNFLFTKYKLWT